MLRRVFRAATSCYVPCNAYLCLTLRVPPSPATRSSVSSYVFLRLQLCVPPSLATRSSVYYHTCIIQIPHVINELPECGKSW